MSRSGVQFPSPAPWSREGIVVPQRLWPDGAFCMSSVPLTDHVVAGPPVSHLCHVRVAQKDQDTLLGGQGSVENGEITAAREAESDKRLLVGLIAMAELAGVGLSTR